MVAIVRGERHLSDWLLYHHIVGVHTYVLLSNECGGLAHSKLLSAANVASPCGYRIRVLVDSTFRCATRFQTAAYRHAITLLLSLRDLDPRQTRVAFTDVDEYMILPSGRSIGELGPPSTPMWTVSQTLYGSSARQSVASGFVPANFIMAAAPTSSCSYCAEQELRELEQKRDHKSICSLAELDSAGPNRTFPGANGMWVHECLPHDRSVALPKGVVSLAHYWAMSDEEFQHKLDRRRPDFPGARYRTRYYQPLYNDHVDLGLLEGLLRRDTGSCSIEFENARYSTPVREALKQHCSPLANQSSENRACTRLVSATPPSASAFEMGVERPFFSLLHETKRCCKEGGGLQLNLLLTTRKHVAHNASACEPLCLRDFACGFFSHHVLGACILWSSCTKLCAALDGATHTTWRRERHADTVHI
jgi:hypothetical protein